MAGEGIRVAYETATSTVKTLSLDPDARKVRFINLGGAGRVVFQIDDYPSAGDPVDGQSNFWMLPAAISHKEATSRAGDSTTVKFRSTADTLVCFEVIDDE